MPTPDPPRPRSLQRTGAERNWGAEAQGGLLENSGWGYPGRTKTEGQGSGDGKLLQDTTQTKRPRVRISAPHRSGAATGTGQTEQRKKVSAAFRGSNTGPSILTAQEAKSKWQLAQGLLHPTPGFQGSPLHPSSGRRMNSGWCLARVASVIRSVAIRGSQEPHLASACIRR